MIQPGIAPHCYTCKQQAVIVGFTVLGPHKVKLFVFCPTCFQVGESCQGEYDLNLLDFVEDKRDDGPYL